MSTSIDEDTILNCWIDCDPGLDDAFALVMATSLSRLNILGVSSVAGNQTIEKTTRNVLRMMNILGLIDESSSDAKPGGLTFPVIQGASKPLVRKLVTAAHVHGDSGLGNESEFELPPLPKQAMDHVANQTSDDIHFTTRMYRIFKQSSRPVNLIAVGPLTNIALLLLNYPDVVKYIDKLIIFGGSLGSGNIGPVSEFNVHVDPQAASLIFNSFDNLKIHLLPIECGDMTKVSADMLASLKALQTPLSSLLVEFILFLERQLQVDVALYDACAIAYLVEPTMCKSQLARVEIEINNPVSIGQTICDIGNKLKVRDEHKNAHVCLNIDPVKFWNLMLNTVWRASQKCILAQKSN